MTALYENRDLAASVSEKLKVYAQPQRLMILSCLWRGERTVADIGQATGIVQPALSQQLAELRRADLVQTRKEAKQVWYRLADDGVALCVQTMEKIFCETPEHVMPMPPLVSGQDKRPVKGAARFVRMIINR
ncbi:MULTISPECIES: metalloregulator ArsR/SmtB family transcription factor [unclassified Iodidimonas]|jgi:DNA-binding transcriptional ArsR family regulator|uniref:ArsR/SmtB family transcription factor n=1 Tax=unclassified Iodidimonas TaxID=2626145 RepID=UPI0024822F11|nr:MULTISPECIES: metalloregulator ArsR/SmtB family transcription factor [unclassified Iodidimonas]